VADRFFSPDPPVAGQLALLGAEARHLARARRLGLGDFIEVFDGAGHAFRAEVRGLSRDRVDLAIVGPAAPGLAAPFPLTLATAVPKGDRFDWLIEKATELGVERVVPLRTERSVVEPRETKLDRLRRIIVEAAKQCGRDRLMTLERPATWAEYLQREPARTRLVAHPGGAPAPSWPQVVAAQGAALAIGPEGGFTDEEVASALAAGWRLASLGGPLLRIETAGLAGAATWLALAAGHHG